MITGILLFLPLLASLLLLIVPKEQIRTAALGFTLLELALSLAAVFNFSDGFTAQFVSDKPWISSLGIHFHVAMDGINLLMVLLTTLLLPLIILSSFGREFKNPRAFYALILFMQAGLIGVFVSMDAFLFYVSWEAALIPVYFLSAIWGGENRIKVTLKFFIYTIFGSLFMLAGIIYLYLQTPGQHSFDINAFYALNLDRVPQGWIFWAFFLAFAIKMPVFPFHTWQPDTYTSSPTPATMLLAGIMLKMGIYGLIRWLLPIAPWGLADWGNLAMILSVVGIIYASIIAITQKDFKRLIAYSSIAHVGLIAAGIFSLTTEGIQGAMIQMLNHGINVIGLFFIADIIFDRYKTREIASLGGIAVKSPAFAIYFLLILLGTVALPLTNGFVGEFLLLLGVYKYQFWYAVVAGLTIILGAVYMLRMYQKMMYGPSNTLTETGIILSASEKIVLISVSAFIVLIGIYPKPILHLSEASVNNLLFIIQSKLSIIK